ncbi:MAG: carbon storage regulator [Planctomycetaceae bacterium]|nr:carbon storage regulator [Planctomycetaceae bacterium]
MLVLGRQEGEEIVICERIRIRVTSIKGNRVRLAIEAPESDSIRRGELLPFDDFVIQRTAENLAMKVSQ